MTSPATVPSSSSGDPLITPIPTTTTDATKVLHLALKALGVGPGLNVGKAVMAGLVPAIHAAPPQISRLAQTFISSEAYAEAAVFSWMAGSSPAMTEKQNTSSTHT
jgi:hypothetical protein